MKKYGIISLILVLVTACVVLYIKVGNLEYDRQLKEVELSTFKDSVNYLTTKNGELIAKFNSVEIEKRLLKESLDLAGFDIKKLKDENIRWRNISNALKLKLESAGSVQSNVTDTFYIDKVTRDTIRYSTFDSWSNDYLSIYNGQIKNKNISFDYTYQTGIDLILEKTKKQSIVTATLTDPNARVVTANSITIDNKKKWYQRWWFWTSVGATGGYLIAK